MTKTWDLNGKTGLVLVAVLSSAVTVALLWGVMLATGVGFAAGAGDVIHGCVGNASGVLRVVGAPEDCRRSETAIEWSAAGAAPSLTINRRTVHEVVSGPGYTAVESPCDPGEVVTGGGYTLGSIGFNDKVFTNNVAGSAESWVVSLYNDTAFDIDLWVTALCAETAP